MNGFAPAPAPSRRAFLAECELRPVRREEDVAGQALQHAERLLIVLDHGRILRVIDQPDARQDRRAAVEDYVVPLSALLDLHRPGRAAPGMARRQVSRQGYAAETDLVAVADDAIGLRGLVADHLIARRQEVAPAAAREQFGVLLAHHDPGPGLLAERRVAARMVDVRRGC